jgi:hypothetical protein
MKTSHPSFDPEDRALKDAITFKLFDLNMKKKSAEKTPRRIPRSRQRAVHNPLRRMPLMDPYTLKIGDRLQHPDFGEGTLESRDSLDGRSLVYRIEWDRQGDDGWTANDNRWEQVELA